MHLQKFVQLLGCISEVPALFYESLWAKHEFIVFFDRLFSVDGSGARIAATEKHGSGYILFMLNFYFRLDNWGGGMLK